MNINHRNRVYYFCVNRLPFSTVFSHLYDFRAMRIGVS